MEAPRLKEGSLSCASHPSLVFARAWSQICALAFRQRMLALLSSIAPFQGQMTSSSERLESKERELATLLTVES